jgi:hypothetical protein
LRLRGLAWTGSRHDPAQDATALCARVGEVLEQCVSEGLIPHLAYALQVRIDDGFGLPVYRCVISASLGDQRRGRVRDTIEAALVPWNRAVVRDSGVHPLIKVEVRSALG